MDHQMQQHHQMQQSLLASYAMASQQPLQHPDATPQNKLDEARKNLQVLIDSGLSKELLHQWVDDSQSQQLLALPLQDASSLLSQHQQQQQQQQQQAYIPPQPQCPPPPPPTIAPPAPPNRSHSHTGIPAPISVPSVTTTPPSVTTPTEIKTEAIIEDVPSSWPSTPNPVIRGSVAMPEQDHTAAMYMAQAAPFHRPRISVSSTSSGSSGHASIWSTNSGHSAMSWQTAASGASRCQNPLPVPPMTNSIMSNVGAVPAATTVGSRQNIYWCTSCETSFKRKYDWKRHEDEFHERWRKYPCPEPGCNRSFWGSNSFNQHHKQCHGCKTCPHAEKVVKFLRKRKYWACGFCSALHPARERHVEHVARHFESGLTKSDWMHSRVVYGLLHQPLIHEAWDELVLSKQGEHTGRRPQFSWHPSKTGRAQGFLEHENPGQLQDLLEFFSSSEAEAKWIVGVAYELADIVYTNVMVPSPQFSDPSMAPPPFPHDGRMSFGSLPAQPPVLGSSVPSQGQNPFSSPFQNSMFLATQPFAGQTSRPSPDSASQSPMTVSQSPLGSAQQSPHEKRGSNDQSITSSTHGSTGEGGMDFEYSPAPIKFDDWESINSVMADDQSSLHQTGNQGGVSDWGMVSYMNNPPVSS